MKEYPTHDRPTWMSLAACLDSHPDLWFAESGNATHRAKEICSGCPVLEMCLEHAMETNEPDGIWGGQTRAEYSARQKASAA